MSAGYSILLLKERIEHRQLLLSLGWDIVISSWGTLRSTFNQYVTWVPSETFLAVGGKC